MADNTNPTGNDIKEEMSDNKQALIRNVIAIHWNEKFNSDNPIKRPVKKIKHNDIVRLLESIGKNDELMPQLQKLQKYKSINLSSYTKDMLALLEPYFDIEGMELDKETRQMQMVEIFGSWYKKEFPNDKKKNFTINNTTVADLINYLFFNGVESIPNLYDLGIKNVKNYKPVHFDTKAIEKFEALFRQIKTE
jgi:hypothetical protein